MEGREKQTREEGANGGDEEREEGTAQEEAEEEVQTVEEEQEQDPQEEEEDVQESLKDILKELHKEVGELRVQVKDIAQRQEGMERSDKQNRAPINSTRDASDINWRANEHDHECMSMPRLMRVAQSSPADREDDADRQYGRDGGQSARPARVPGLRPVIAGDDLGRYCPVLGVPEKTLKAALTGEYVLVESFLFNNNSNVDDDSKPRELLAQPDGTVMYKSRRRSRAVYNFDSWLEAYLNYTRTMINFHGVSVSEKLLSYVRHIQDYNRKHAWKLVDNVDVENRMSHSGKDIDFSDINVMLLFSSFDRGAARVPGKCDVCRGTDHYAATCPQVGGGGNQPFHANPGQQAGRGQRGSYQGGSYAGSNQGGSNYGRGYNSSTRGGERFITNEICDNWNDSRCYSSSCRRSHICRGCGGDYPYSICVRVSRCAGVQDKAQPRPQ